MLWTRGGWWMVHSGPGKTTVNKDRDRDKSRRSRWLLRDEFSRFATEVLRADWALLSAYSRLSDFDTLMSRGELAKRIEETFGVRTHEVLAEPAPALIDILGRAPRAPLPLERVIEEELEFRELLPRDAASRGRLVRVLTEVANDCRTVRDLKHRLESAYLSATERTDRADFSHWTWLAEDILTRTSRSQW